MKLFGIGLLVIGAAIGCFAMTMDISTIVEAHSYGGGISTPEMKVVNIGLIANRNLVAMLAGVVSVMGAVLFGSGKVIEALAGPVQATTSAHKEVVPVKHTSSVTVRICPACKHHDSGSVTECGNCGRTVEG